MGIHLKEQEYKSILGLLGKYQDGNEFEARVSSNLIDGAKFNNILLYLASTKGEGKREQETLDLSADNYRLTLVGVDQIALFCKSNSVDRADLETLMIMEKKKGDRYSLPDYDLRFGLATERQVTERREKENALLSFKGKKSFRLKKRFSFMTEDKLFRIDATAVRESSDSFDMLSFARIQERCEKYELEVEYVGKAFKDAVPVVKSLFRTLSELLKVIQDVDTLMRKSQREQILNQYIALVKKEMGVKETIGVPLRKLYLAVKPVTLERRHLIATETINITEKYTCTEKADGERMLLYVADDKLYMINNRLEVIATKIECPPGWNNSLFDTEYVTLISKSKAIMVFDAYYIKGKLVAKLPLADAKGDSRLAHVQQFVAEKLKFPSDKLSVRAKQFKIASAEKSIFECAQEIMEMVETGSKFPYHVDGLIFTPAHLPVGASTPKDGVSFRGTWEHVLKWKPPQENTIDFLVTQNPELAVDHLRFCNIVPFQEVPLAKKQLYLYCGRRTGSITAKEYYLQPELIGKQQGYRAVLFKPPGSLGEELCSCEVTADREGRIKCTNGDVISDGCIVECSWNGTSWEPYRVRRDKTEYMRKTKSISSTANDFEIAVSVWRTILYPVTQDHITGVEELSATEVPKDDDRYYARNIQRIKSATLPMMTFHNYWVKNKHLISRIANAGATSLMDIACGKAGDLSKWVNNGYHTVLGVDLSLDNINNTDDGAYARLAQEKSITPRHKYAFVKLDSTLTYDKKQIEALPDADPANQFNKRMASIIWGLEKPSEPELARFYKMAEQKFEVISCQFALHYFFKDGATLTNAIKNITAHIAENGYFIGTCFDGDSVAKLLKTLKQGEKATGKKENQLIWSIEKRYDTYRQDELGQEIDVYIHTINNVFTEYLVPFTRLTAELEKHDIRLMDKDECELLGLESSTGLFDELFNEMTSTAPNNHSVQQASKLEESKAEQTLSFLNRWFIFKKAKAKPKKSTPKLIVKKKSST